MTYKIVIPTAGTGSRLGTLTKDTNKALLPIAGKAVISHILSRFPADKPIVIPLGYKGENVKEFLLKNHPERHFKFRTVDPYEGDGSGLGYTMLCCEDLLQTPFIFCSNDTIVGGNVPSPDHNWMGYAHVTETDQYRCLKISKDGAVEKICEKGATEKNIEPYIGLAGIHDYELFWSAMNKNKDIAIATGESHGLRTLIEEKTVTAYLFDWHDTGNIAALRETEAELQNEL
ncbi:MAG: hypothetical protein KDI13_09900 [Alphaproteobacteria bacterium]|nr:hypothetical protein [Alphaproteobacteria bacterium]